jgi:nucleoside-diphosphate-sugar epimerase
MKISIIGSTGFVGFYIINSLNESDHTIKILVRPGSEDKIPKPTTSTPSNIEIVKGDISNIDSIYECLAETDVVIYLIGILREVPKQNITFEETQYLGVERTVHAAKAQGVKKFILMSANGAKPDGTTYQNTKFRAEECVKASGLDWTIFRPSVIFGDPNGKMEFCTQLLAELINPPIPAPLFFPGLNIHQAGKFKLQPVHVEDVAQAFVQAIDNPTLNKHTFTLCGSQSASWHEIIQTLAKASGKNGKLTLPAPADIVKLVASVFDKYAWFPITKDQIIMLLEGNVCEDNSIWETLGIKPKNFSLENLTYLRES